MNSIASILTFALLGSFGGASLTWAGGTPSCRLPAADNQEASPPNLQGKVASIDVSKKSLKVTPTKGKREVSIAKINEKGLFSNFGGLLRVDEIKVGDMVRAWSKDCAAPVKGKLSAEALIVDK